MPSWRRRPGQRKRRRGSRISDSRSSVPPAFFCSGSMPNRKPFTKIHNSALNRLNHCEVTSRRRRSRNRRSLSFVTSSSARL
jgi:hypothetical protein